nr:hypothetical protein [Angustibacter aerolatus]
MEVWHVGGGGVDLPALAREPEGAGRAGGLVGQPQLRAHRRTALPGRSRIRPRAVRRAGACPAAATRRRRRWRCSTPASPRRSTRRCGPACWGWTTPTSTRSTRTTTTTSTPRRGTAPSSPGSCSASRRAWRPSSSGCSTATASATTPASRSACCRPARPS